MAKARGRSARYPRKLLQDVDWCFCRPLFRSLARFEEACRRYYRDVGFEWNWRPEEVVLPCPRARAAGLLG